MRNSIRGTVCLISLAVIISGCNTGNTVEPAAVAGDARAANDPVARGRIIYQQNCQTCHGTRGLGDGPTAFQCSTKPANLVAPDVADLSSKKLLRKVSEGGSGMPAFDRLLDEQDRRDVVQYVQMMGRSASAASGRQAHAYSNY